jgi:murein DD-endopeptidase MepM/ murein hydrolase activator NlpD
MKKLIIFLSITFLNIYIGYSLYNYYFDTSIPVISNITVLEDGKTYAGSIKFSIEGYDDYKVKNISVLLDGKPLIHNHCVNSKKFSFPLFIQTLSLENGKHELIIIVTDASKKAHTIEKHITFYVDNMPLEVKFINNHENIKVHQGNTLHISFQGNKDTIKGYAKTLTHEIPCVNESHGSRIYECFIPISTDEIPNTYLLSLNLEDAVGNKAVLETKYEIISQNFKKQTIGLQNKKLEDEPGKPQSQFNYEMEIISKQSPHKKMWVGKFCEPCAYKCISTDFGVVRTSKELGRYRHDAIDFNATPKSSVWACQNGIVVLKDTFQCTGNTVVIDHGCGITTVYAHLDSFAPTIEVGKEIKKGNILGTIGMTGYATGYHLHLELRINNIKVNPLEWIKEN